LERKAALEQIDLGKWYQILSWTS